MTREEHDRTFTGLEECIDIKTIRTHTSPMPSRRIHRSRAKGWRMPKGAVYVGRPSQWGNPFEVDVLGQQGAVDAYAVHLAAYFGWEDRTVLRAFFPWPVHSTAFRDWLAPLRGRDLACWCQPSDPCHADVLLELANA